jgi:hypothetical protein
MGNWDLAELDRRQHARRRPRQRCELYVADRCHEAVVVDASAGGLYVESDAPAWPGALVRLRVGQWERYAIVMRERQIPLRLRGLLPRGFGLRWLSVRSAD